MTEKEWEVYQRAMKPVREQPPKKEKPSRERPTELFRKIIGS